MQLLLCEQVSSLIMHPFFYRQKILKMFNCFFVCRKCFVKPKIDDVSIDVILFNMYMYVKLLIQYDFRIWYYALYESFRDLN